MKRSELEHLIRAAGRIADDREIVVIGSQAILGQFPDAPPALCRSMEGDIYPRNNPERADKVDGAIGEGSKFHEQFGYYAQGVAPDTATLPRGWQRRLVRVSNQNTGVYAGLCLEVHDLAISKYVAEREKDLEFTRELARHAMTDKRILLNAALSNEARPGACEDRARPHRPRLCPPPRLARLPGERYSQRLPGVRRGPEKYYRKTSKFNATGSPNHDACVV